MPGARRVHSRDVAQAGSLNALISKLIDTVRSGNMEQKEHAVMMLHSLTEQPKGLDGIQDADNTVLIARAGAIKPLVNLVIIGSPVAQGHACGTLSVIAHGQREYQDAIIESGGVVAITACLRGGDAGVQEHAAAAIASVSELKSQQKPIMKAGAVIPLVMLLRCARDDTHVHVGFALANLADDNPDGQTAIARTGALPLLIGLLGSGKAQESVATAIAKLTQGHEVNQAEVTRLGGIPKLIALLSALNVESQAQAAAALAALASGDNRDEQDVIAKAGGIRPLLALVESRYSSAQRSSVNALAMLANNNLENQDAIAAMGGIMPLVLLTQQGAASPDVQAQAVLALTEISRHNHANQSATADAGAISSLVALLRFSNQPLVEAEVAGAFWALSEDHMPNKESIAAAGAIPPLITSQLASLSERAHTNAGHALASLAYGNETNQAEIAALLVSLLEDGQQGSQERAVAALWRMVKENPGNEAAIAKASGAEPLVRLLRGKQPSTKSYSLWALSLSIDAENRTPSTSVCPRPLCMPCSAWCLLRRVWHCPRCSY